MKTATVTNVVGKLERQKTGRNSTGTKLKSIQLREVLSVNNVIWLGLAVAVGCAMLAAVGWIARTIVEWRDHDRTT